MLPIVVVVVVVSHLPFSYFDYLTTNRMRAMSDDAVSSLTYDINNDLHLDGDANSPMNPYRYTHLGI